MLGLDRLFGRRKPVQPPGFTLSGCVSTDPGCHRETNEDSGRLFEPSDRELRARKGILLVVADGMGGHQAGEVASRTAVETLGRAYYDAPGDPTSSLAQGFERANQEIQRLARAQPECHGMGTTCTAVAVVGQEAYAAHVGDTRLYLVRNQQIFQMTEDHSAVREMVRQGTITAEQARHHEDRNVLLRALGTRPEVAVDTFPEPFPVIRGDRLVICTDGLHDLVEQQEIRDLVQAKPPKAACAALIGLARARGGYDNITVGVVALDSIGAMRETRALEVPA